MRLNNFGECYCHTADEARHLVEMHDGDAYVPDSTIESEDREWQATAEVADSHSGDLICYIEAPTETKVRAIIAELGLEIV